VPGVFASIVVGNKGMDRRAALPARLGAKPRQPPRAVQLLIIRTT